ncbi:MAG: LysR substrate-binding domain-containing protein [Pseudomonadota bacterium]|nr:LysR substrate-binding domain-containing protein [Pseudomonadota bacterium]
MELRQLRSLVALVESDFSVSRAAARLNLVQPAVSQHLKQVEEELGTHLFRRYGKRLVGLTDAGEKVVHYARRTLADTANILAIGQDHVEDDSGVLRIGTTHTQARYVLPPAIRLFREAYPAVEVQIHQGTPRQLVDMTLQDLVDVAICTEAVGNHPALSAIPCYRWNRCLIAPLGHPVLDVRPITLELLCEHPMITYVSGFTGRGQLSDTFAKEGLRPRVVLSAADTDVIKTYVREGLGLGVIAALAHEPEQDADLGKRDLSHLFPWEVAKIAYLRDKYLRRFQQQFMDLFQREAAAISRRKR